MKTPNRPPSCDLPPEFYGPRLKPCPFCESHLVEMLYEGHNEGFARCEACDADGPLSDTIDGKSWNAAPRRSEVLELIRLVDGYFAGKTDPLDLRICATKLREQIRE